MDVLGDVSHRNYTTRIHLEDLVVGDNNSLVYVTQLAPRLSPDLAPTPGYGLYWRLMVPVAAWFQVIDKDVNIFCGYKYLLIESINISCNVLKICKSLS